MKEYILAYDMGTTGCKTCLYSIDSTVRLEAYSKKDYSLQLLENGGVEQDPEEWWQALVTTTARIITETAIPPESVKALSFCSQMQGLVLVDKHGAALRPAMSYMDQRAVREKKEMAGSGITIQGMNIIKLLLSLFINGGAAISVKDPLWKYKWVEKNEPALFYRIYKWLDVKDYLIAKCSGQFIMTEDSAFATFLYDTRRKKKKWSPLLCRLFQVNIKHLPRVILSTDRVGPITEEAVEELGLTRSCDVYGGGGDASLIGIGAGASLPGDTHIYSGTSGWISTLVRKKIIDLNHRMTSVPGAQEGFFNYFGELETSGKCLEWVRDHLALDAINIYLEKIQITDDPASRYNNLYEYMCETINDIPPGSGGVIFTPWLHGNRCPFEDPAARGVFFNISLDTGKRKMIRAVLEGVAYHIAWMFEVSRKKTGEPNEIRFVGGGAGSPLTCQILADITNRTILTVEHPQNAGAMGAALCAAIGMKMIPSFHSVKEYIPIQRIYAPNPVLRAVYKRQEKVFRRLYRNNRKNFHLLNTNNFDNRKQTSVDLQPM